jgi:hypothetical protein
MLHVEFAKSRYEALKSELAACDLKGRRALIESEMLTISHELACYEAARLPAQPKPACS